MSRKSGNRRWWQSADMVEAGLIPQARFSGPMPWVIAIMVALTVIAAAAGLALRNTASATRAELSGGITIQIVEADPETRARQAEAALAALRETPGITALRNVPPAEINALVEPWLGDAVGQGETIPVPALIDARVEGQASPERIADLQRSLRAVAPAARVDAQSSWLKPVFDAILSLQWLALALVGLLAFALGAAVLLAVRMALGANREAIEVVHLLGANDGQIAHLFQRSIGIDAAAGGGLGFAAGAAVVVFLGQRFAELGAGLVNGGAFGWLDWVALVLIPIGGVALAMLTARISVLRALRRML